MSNKEYIVNWDTIGTVSVKGKTTLVFDDAKLAQLEFTVNDNVFTCIYGDKKTELTNYSKIKNLKTKEGESSEYTSTDIIALQRVNNLKVYDTPVKNKVSGTNYNDTVFLADFTRYDKYNNPVDDFYKKTSGIKINTLNGKDNITATQYADTINAGGGDDTIYSSLGNDKITGGKGETTLVYGGKFDTDTITLTKTEQLTIDLKSYGFTDVSDLTFKTTSSSLEITVEKEHIVYGKIILKNFKKSNVVGANGKVLIDIGAGNPIDLNKDDFLLWNKTDFSSKGVFTGTRFSETIDASGVTTAYGKNNKGVTIKAGAGYNTIIGTEGFNDTITGGNDGNDISVGSGDNKVTTGSGIDKVTINGAGSNTIKTGKGNDEITLRNLTSANIFAGAGINKITVDNTADFGNIVIKEEKVSAENHLIFTSGNLSEFYLNRKGNNLVISSVDDSSSVTINSYFSTGKKFAQTKFYINETLIESFDDLISMTKGFVITGKGNILGTEYDDAIVADDYLLSKSNNDNITPMKGNDSVNAGKGNNTININKGDGTKTILDGGGADTLAFQSGTELSYLADSKSLIIYYGDSEEDKVILNNYFESTSVEYIKIGNKKEKLSTYCTSLQRGGELREIVLNPSVTTKLILTDTFSGENYEYFLKSLSGEQNIKLEYLKNGRLYIDCDYTQIIASDNQADDLIITGEHNKMDTGDENDIVRVGYVVDSKGEVEEYTVQSDYNVINTGAGDDYVTYYGLMNSTDTGDGDDKVFLIGKQAVIEDEDIKNAETIRKTDSQLPVTNSIGWFNQGEGGGDCRLFALLDSMKRSEGFSLEDYVSIIDNLDESYTVTFKNYNHPNNSKIVCLSDLTEFTNVYGDLDVVLIDYAMNELIYENRDFHLGSVQKAYYNTIADYIFGAGVNMKEAGEDTGDITVTDYSNPDFDTRFNTLWTLYANGEIDNITVGIQPISNMDDSDYKLGVLKSHAYSIKDFDGTHITLVNPWDSADCLKLDYSFFRTFNTCVIVYGIDYYDEYNLVDNGYRTAESNDFDGYITDISAETASWLSSCSLNIAEITYIDDYNKNSAEVLCINPTSDLI